MAVQDGPGHDERWMRRALALAERGRHTVSPTPLAHAAHAQRASRYARQGHVPATWPSRQRQAGDGSRTRPATRPACSFPPYGRESCIPTALPVRSGCSFPPDLEESCVPALGGGGVRRLFVAAGLIDTLVHVTPLLLAAGGLPALPGDRIRTLVEAVRLHLDAVEQVDADVVLTPLIPRSRNDVRHDHRSHHGHR